MASNDDLLEETLSEVTLADVLDDVVLCVCAVEKLSLIRHLTILRYLDSRLGVDGGSSFSNQEILVTYKAVQNEVVEAVRCLREKKLRIEGNSLAEISQMFDSVGDEQNDHWLQRLKTEENRQLAKILCKA